jgi:hypothetical protein
MKTNPERITYTPVVLGSEMYFHIQRITKDNAETLYLGKSETEADQTYTNAENNQ